MYIYKNIHKVYGDVYWTIDNTLADNPCFDVEKHEIKTLKDFHMEKNCYGETYFFKEGNPHGFDVYQDNEENPFIYDDWSGELYYLELVS